MSAVIIFDCDGVLLDSEAIYAEVGARTLTAAGIPITADELVRRFAGIPGKQVFEDLQAEHNVDLPASFFSEQRIELDRAFARDLKAIDGAHALLGRMTLPFCVASSTGLPRLTECLTLTGLAPFFDGRIYSASMVEKGKPAPDLFIYAAAQMNSEPRSCLVLEDSVAGVTAAVAAGMKAIGFIGASHVPDGQDAALRAAGAAVVIDRLDQFDGEIADFLDGN